MCNKGLAFVVGGDDTDMFLFFFSRLLPELASQADSRPERVSGARPSRLCCYDLDDLDVAWLELVNHEFRLMGESETTAVRSKKEKAAL